MKKTFLAVVAFGAVFVGQMQSVQAYGYGSSYGGYGSPGIYGGYSGGSSYSINSWSSRMREEAEARRENNYRANMNKIHEDSNKAIAKHFKEVNGRNYSFDFSSSTPSSSRVKFVNAKVATFCAPGVNNKERCDRYCGELNAYGIKNKLCPVIAKNKK